VAPYRVYLVLARLLPVAVLSQIGLALFGIPLAVHAIVGVAIGMMAILLVWLTHTLRLTGSQWVLSVGLVALVGLQPCFILLSMRLSVLEALHPINAFVILGLALALGLDTDESGSDSRRQPEVPSTRR
jgi:hypothetical protein